MCFLEEERIIPFKKSQNNELDFFLKDKWSIIKKRIDPPSTRTNRLTYFIKNPDPGPVRVPVRGPEEAQQQSGYSGKNKGEEPANSLASLN